MSAESDNLTPSRFAQDMAAAADRFDIERGNPSSLLLDLDTPAALEQFARVLPKVRENFGVRSVEQWASKSGNTHVRVWLTTPQPIAVWLALQAALGSDGVREVLGLKRMENGVVEPSVLFRPRAPVDVFVDA